MLRASKSAYINNLAANCKHQPSKFWNSISYLSNKEKLSTGSTLTGSANDYNNHFLSIGSQCSANISACGVSPTSFLEHLSQVPAFSFHLVNEEDVCYLLKDINIRKSTGPDLIPAVFIKKFQLFLIKPLTAIINRSLDRSYVPKVWKQANVIPIQKK